MIPISGDQVLTHKDEKTGIIYSFRPLLGDAEYAYYAALDALSSKLDHEPYLLMAEKEIDAENSGKKWEKGEREIAIRAEAINMAAKETERTPEDVKAQMRALDSLIDSVLIGWDAPAGVKCPAFKPPPSSCFQRKGKVRLFKWIMALNDKLTEDEEKN